MPKDTYLRKLIKASGAKICAQVRKDMEAGKIDYKEEFVITELFNFVGQSTDRVNKIRADKNIVYQHFADKKEVARAAQAENTSESKEDFNRGIDITAINEVLFTKDNNPDIKDLWNGLTGKLRYKK